MEDNIKLLVSETTRLCREQGFQVEPHVIAYLACLSDAQKSWEDAVPGAALTEPMGPHTVAALGKFLCALVSKQDDPSLATARMQVLMEVAYKQQRDVVEQEAASKQERVDMLSRAVLSPKPLRDNSSESYDRFYRCLLEYVCVASSLDAALNETAASEEVKAALESVLPLSGIARFLTLSAEDKALQVDELCRLCVGILLYNRSEGRGGHALPAAAATYLPQAARLVRELRGGVYDLSEQATACLPLVARAEGPARERAMHEMINRCQAQALAESLQADTEAGLEVTNALSAELEHLLIEVQEHIGSSTAVAKDMVYPLMDRLGSIHSALHSELRMLVVRQRLFERFRELQGGYTPCTAAGEAGADMGSSAAVTLSEESKELLQDLPASYQYVSPASSSSGAAFNGYSPVALGIEGLLRKGNPVLGGIRYQEQLYLFVNDKELRMFVADPTAALSGASIHFTQHPTLARLLGRTQHLHTMDMAKIVSVLSGPLKVDCGCQTPTHFVERHIDHSYEWNEWALRRRALALANLRQKRTHSSQTAATHFKRDNDTQVWRPKQATVQTRVVKGQSMPKKLQYVAGLRGAPNVKMNVVRLEMDLGQPHQY